MYSQNKFSCLFNNFTNHQPLRKIHTSKVRIIFVSSKKWNQDNIAQEKKISWSDKLKQWYEAYQVFVGLSDIKKTHERVTDLSGKAQGFASIRRELYEKLEDIHNQRYYDYQKMTHTNIESEEYSKLQEKHYELKSQLRVLRKEFRTCERNERQTFEQLFISMRDCNRKEGYLAEQSKYWSIIASVISAILASLFTSLNNWSRFKELREMTEEVAHKEIKISSDDLNQIEDIVNKATENVSEKVVNKEIKIANQIEAIVKAATENVSEKIVYKGIKISSDDLNQIEAIVKEATKNESEKMVDKEIKISNENLNQIKAAVKEATKNASEKRVDKEIKISSEDLNQIEAIVKEATEDVSEKIIGKHYSSGISKAMSDERSNRALAAGVGIGVSIGTLISAILYILMDTED